MRDDWRLTLDAGSIAVLAGPASAQVQAARETCRDLAAELHRAAGTTVFQSRSATRGALAIAMCRTRPVGVDIEALRPEWVDDDLLELTLHPCERANLPAAGAKHAFFELWTRKEAVLKALGTGLALKPAGIQVGWDPDWQSVAVIGATIHVRNLWSEADTTLAIAATGTRPSVRQWTWNCELRGWIPHCTDQGTREGWLPAGKARGR